jgi:hypothetical protein
MPATLTDRVAELRTEAQAIIDTAIAADRAPTAEEQAAFDARLDAISRLASLDATTGQVTELLTRGAPSAIAGQPRTDFGSEFVTSAVVQAIRQAYPSGLADDVRLPAGFGGAVTIPGVRQLLQDPGISPHRNVIDAPTGVAAFDLLRVITIIEESERTVDHHTATFTNNAAVVAESDGDPEDTVGVKPESELEWTTVTLNQGVVAHQMPVTNQALNNNAGLAQRINAFMVNGVRARAQATVATQLAAWSGLQAQAWDTNIRRTLRKAITKAQTAAAITGGGPISILISAADAEALDLEMLATLTVQPGQELQPVERIWRAPLVVVASGLAPGFAYVGDPSQIVWYTRGGLQLAVGLVNDQFVRNEQTIRAETQGVTGVLNAGAMVRTDVAA